ncbi:MAG TPA: tRNA preQ1(34) S-adenosylmethionine ribosyltransferase-isomerase QueA [Candidatus Eremiobacteraceae bacterium]|nr:tRNA preQ1(34) S-adenosylmethionine ribosyltransferase-isomerase QueA [Candidatus Eremiobacteraceae bacterium]
MQSPGEHRTEAYSYSLPDELIAQRPSDVRDASRLLVVPRSGDFRHRVFSDIIEELREGDLLVANDARVLRARLRASRAGGGAAEVLLLHPAADPGVWEAMVRPGRRIRPGDTLTLAKDATIAILDRTPAGGRLVRFDGLEADEAMVRFGSLPLPPYIAIPPPDADERYQTVYARAASSVAAPTAGLHFTHALLDRLRERRIGWTTLTLDVGAGTFRPVNVSDLRAHVMHRERFEIAASTARAINDARAARRRIVAVGTTSLRAMESSVTDDGHVAEGVRTTELFIYPPYRFRIVDALITNFHLPRSTLLMLVCAFAGRERMLSAYEEAVSRRYRFFSFGDAMFVERPS